MNEYVFENGIAMPLCAVIDDIYFDYLSGQVIENEDVLSFIKNGIKNKSLNIKKINLIIYVIEEYILPTYDRRFIAYNYQINGSSNYLNIKKQPVDDITRQHIIDKLMNNEYIQEIIWGDK